MCEFCHKHGEGEKWYLQAKNYAEELLGDPKRVKFIEEFFADPMRMAEDDQKTQKLKSHHLKLLNMHVKQL